MTNNVWNEKEEHTGMDNKEWKLIEKLVMSSQKEQRKARLWGIGFKLLTFAYLFVILFMFSPGSWMDQSVTVHNNHTALVEIQGVIAETELSNADNIVSGLRDAFENDKTKGVILRINSPGGTPVQAGYIYDEIRRLRDEYSAIKLYAVISDIGASGGYYIASAADEIYADKASLVGSIGVISSQFGFVDAMEKLGIERRVFTAGENKAFLDPFSPMRSDDKKFWQNVLNVTHQQFIARVKEGRGDRLKDDPSLFSGLIWSGEQALELGLVDGLGSAGHVARELIGAEHIIDFTPRRSPFEQFTDRLGVSIGRTLSNYFGVNGAPRYQ